MTARHGPLTALAGTTPALAVGDIELRHVRFTLAGVAWHRGHTRRFFAPWPEVTVLSIDPPKTWWPHPLVGDWVIPIVEGVLGGGGGEVREPDPYFARIVLGDGDEKLWEIDRHYISGYRRRDARATARLVEHFVASAPSRTLLARPDAVIDRISAVLRTAS